jgi:hypothetical protein
MEAALSMARALRHCDRVTHRPPNAADAGGLRKALQALYAGKPMTPEEVAAYEHEARSVPYRKRQADLALVLPDGEPT